MNGDAKENPPNPDKFLDSSLSSWFKKVTKLPIITLLDIIDGTHSNALLSRLDPDITYHPITPADIISSNEVLYKNFLNSIKNLRLFFKKRGIVLICAPINVYSTVSYCINTKNGLRHNSGDSDISNASSSSKSSSFSKFKNIASKSVFKDLENYLCLLLIAASDSSSEPEARNFCIEQIRVLPENQQTKIMNLLQNSKNLVTNLSWIRDQNISLSAADYEDRCQNLEYVINRLSQLLEREVDNLAEFLINNNLVEKNGSRAVIRQSSFSTRSETQVNNILQRKYALQKEAYDTIQYEYDELKIELETLKEKNIAQRDQIIELNQQKHQNINLKEELEEYKQKLSSLNSVVEENKTLKTKLHDYDYQTSKLNAFQQKNEDLETYVSEQEKTLQDQKLQLIKLRNIEEENTNLRAKKFDLESYITEQESIVEQFKQQINILEKKQEFDLASPRPMEPNKSLAEENQEVWNNERDQLIKKINTLELEKTQIQSIDGYMNLY